MSILVSVPFCAWVSYTDLKEGKIRNNATYTLFLIGIAYKLMLVGWGSLGDILSMVFLITMLLAGMKAKYGGGDLKLIIATGVFLPGWLLPAYIFLVFAAIMVTAMAKYSLLHGVSALVNAFKADFISGGLLERESVHIKAGPVISTVFILHIAYLFWLGVA